MHRRIARKSLIATILFIAASASLGEALTPPDAQKQPRELSAHGQTRIDNYYWMRDRDDPQVIEYLEAENRFLESAMADTVSLQQELFDEMVARLDPDDESVPYELNGYWYYRRYEEGAQLSHLLSP